jgi:hypothetical protein
MIQRLTFEAHKKSTTLFYVKLGSFMETLKTRASYLALHAQNTNASIWEVSLTERKFSSLSFSFSSLSLTKCGSSCVFLEMSRCRQTWLDEEDDDLLRINDWTIESIARTARRMVKSRVGDIPLKLGVGTPLEDEIRKRKERARPACSRTIPSDEETRWERNVRCS